MFIINLIRGFFMALADSVPGVSGGTIAFILGFYDDFINSLNSLMSRDSMDDKKNSLIFLFKLGIGWVIGMILSVLFLSSIFDAEIYKIRRLYKGSASLLLLCDFLYALTLKVRYNKHILKLSYVRSRLNNSVA